MGLGESHHFSLCSALFFKADFIYTNQEQVWLYVVNTTITFQKYISFLVSLMLSDSFIVGDRLLVIVGGYVLLVKFCLKPHAHMYPIIIIGDWRYLTKLGFADTDHQLVRSSGIQGPRQAYHDVLDTTAVTPS